MSTVKWTTNTGTEIVITLETVFGIDLQGRRKTSGEKIVEISGTVNGENHKMLMGLQPITGHMYRRAWVCVARLGDIGLNQDQLDQITTIKSDLEESIKQHNDDLDQHISKLDSLGTGDINKEFGYNS